MEEHFRRTIEANSPVPAPEPATAPALAPASPAAPAPAPTPAAPPTPPAAEPAPAADTAPAPASPLTSDDITFDEGEEASLAKPAAAAPTPAQTPAPTPEAPKPGKNTDSLGDFTEAEAIALLAKPRGQRMLKADKIFRALEAPPADDGTGGIGYVPQSVDEVKSWYESAVQFDNMLAEFEAAPASFLANFFGPQDDGHLRPGAAEAISILPQFLAKAAPQLYTETIRRPIYDEVVKRLDALIADPNVAEDDKTQVKTAARVVDWVLRKVDRTKTPDPNSPDPLSAERRRLADERKEIADRNRASAQERVSHFTSSTESAATAAVRADVTRIFTSRLEGRSARDIAAHVDQFMSNHVIPRVIGIDGNGTQSVSPMEFSRFTTHLQRLQHEAARGVKVNATPLIETYRRMARLAIRLEAPAYLNEVIGTIARGTTAPANGTSPATQPATVQRPEPSTASAPAAPRSVAEAPSGPIKLLPGEDRADAYARHFRERIAASGATRI
jgi:hypothetical protein